MIFYNSVQSNLSLKLSFRLRLFRLSTKHHVRKILLTSRDHRVVSEQSKGERVTREPFKHPSVRRRVTLLHENCVNAIPRIKLPKSFPFDPLQTLPPCPYWPSRRGLLCHLACGRRHCRDLIFCISTCPPFNKSQYSCRQC